MPTVINDVTLEPQAGPPAQVQAVGAEKSGSGGGAKSGPELERELSKIHRRQHERALRLRA
jgi:hypothetical protein